MKFYYILIAFLGLASQQLIGTENFILINSLTNEVIQEFGDNLDERVTPACSFNIALSLMGYDAGILKDEQNPVWPFEPYYDNSSESWKFPHSPKTWMDHSCLWYSKILSLALGSAEFESYLQIFNYGNKDFSTGMVVPGPLNPAWVSSSIKISPREQVDFICRMVQGKLAISEDAFLMTRTILHKEDIAIGKLFGKTGLGTTISENGEQLKARWFVGWLERDSQSFPFAYLLKESKVNIQQTVPRVKELLTQLSYP